MMDNKFPCGICQKFLSVKRKPICCDLCDKCIHIVCTNLDKKTYKHLQGSTTNWFCITCIKNEIPFLSQTDHELEQTNSGMVIVPVKTKDIETY